MTQEPPGRNFDRHAAYVVVAFVAGGSAFTSVRPARRW